MKGSFLRAFLVLMIGFAIGCGGNGDPQVTDEECQASGKVVVGKDCLPKCKEGQGGECACGGGEVWEKCTEGNVCRGADVAGKCMAIADAPKCDDGEVVDALCICGGSECSLGKTCLANDCLDFCVEGESDCACGEGEHLEKCEDGKVCLDLGEGMACGTKEPSSTDCESGDIAQALGCTCADKECTAGELCLIEEGSNVGSCHEVCRLDAVTNATCKCADNSDNWHVCGEGGYCRRTAGCAEACKSQGNKWCLCGDESTYCDEGSVCARIVGDTMGCMPECGVRPEADACWCYYRDKTMTAICRDGNVCTNENGCSCGGGKACVNGHSCRLDECKCGDRDECSLGKTCLANDCLDFCVEGESDCACGEGEHLEKCEDGKVCLDLGEGMACGTKEPSSTDCESGDIAQALGCTCADKECTAGELCLIEEGSNVGSCHEVCRLDAVTNATCKCADNSDNWHVCGEGGYCRRTAGCAEACKSQGNKWCLCGDESTYCDEGSVCARIVGDTMGCMPECGVRPEADACWCYYRDKNMTAICRDGNVCTNENGCSCGGGKACVNGHSCRLDECKCGDRDVCTGAHRCVEGECRCGLQDEADWTNPGCTNGADCDPTTGGCKKAKDSTAILAYGSNVGDPTEWYSDADNKIRGVVCDEDHVGVRLCRGNETGAKVGWAECNGEHWRMMEECAADELCSDGMGCVRSCGPEADCGASGSCADAGVYLEPLGDVYDATGKVEAGITKICMCGQGLGCRGLMGCQVNLFGIPGQCASNGAFDDVVLAASNCRAGEFLFGIGKDGQKICTCGESMKSCRGAGHCKTTKTSSEQWPYQAGDGWMCGLPAGQELPGDASAYCYDKEALGEYSSFGPICRCGDNKPCKWNGECSGDVCMDNTEDDTGCYESEWPGADRICRCGSLDEPCSPGQVCVSTNTDGGSVCQAAKWQGIGSARLVTLSLSLPCSEGNPFCGPGEFCFGSDGCRCGKAPGCGSGDVCTFSRVTNKWECL